MRTPDVAENLHYNCKWRCNTPPIPPGILISTQLNVEYNQLDPLLREATGEGDVNDANTGFSPYPGNINQLVFALGPYSKVCPAGIVLLWDPSQEMCGTQDRGCFL